MARVAYVMEGIMSKLGLSGKAFIPMLLGFGCTVPAIMASRALENKRDRYKVMLVAYSMYLIEIIVAMIVSVLLHLIDRKKSVNYLMIELPEYKMPDSRTVAVYVWEKVKDYLGKAGTTIFLATILIWVLLNFGTQEFSTDMTNSFGAIIGKWMVPVFAPIGLVFCLLYIPCAVTLATIRKESSWACTGFTAIFQLAIAWIVTFGVYQIGNFLM